MSAPKHTPGPWRVGLNRNVIPSRVEVWARKDALCVAGGLGDGPEAEANAALIASAPDLAARIAALESLLTEKQRQCDVLTDALIAIAKVDDAEAYDAQARTYMGGLARAALEGRSE